MDGTTTTRGAGRHRRRAVALALLLATALPLAVIDAAPASAAPPPIGTITGHATVEDNGIDAPGTITPGPDGAVWFVNRGNHSIGRVSTTGVVTNYWDPTINLPHGIAAGPDGALWFANSGTGTIGRITTAGAVSVLPGVSIPGVTQLVAGSDGAMWFTRYGLAGIGRLTTAGVVSEFTDPLMQAPHSLTLATDGAIWFGDRNFVSRITPAGTVTQVDVAEPRSGEPHDVRSVVAGADGFIRYTSHLSYCCDFFPPSEFLEIDHSRVGKLTTGGVLVDSFEMDNVRLDEVVVGPDGLARVDALARYPGSQLTFDMVLVEIPGGWADSGGGVPELTDLVAAPDGIWFTKAEADLVGRFAPGTPLTVTATPESAPPEAITTGTDGAIWFTTPPSTITRLGLDGGLTSFTTTAPLLVGTPIVAGPDGALWFAVDLEPSASIDEALARLAPDGSTKTFPIDEPSGGVRDLAVAPDGSVWFLSTGPATQFVGRMTPGGRFSRISNDAIRDLRGLTAGPDGSMWIANRDNILRIAPDGTVAAQGVDGLSSVTTIAAAPDGTVWAASDHATPAIVRVQKAFGSYWPKRFPTTAVGRVDGLAAGPDGRLWATLSSGALLHMDTSGGHVTVDLDSDRLPVGITGGPDGGMWFTQTRGPVVDATRPRVGRIEVLGTTPVAPRAPRVYARAGDQQLTASWTVSDGGSPLTGVTVTLSPGGATCSWTAGPPTCTIPGLNNGTRYTATARATNAVGTGPVSVLAATGIPHRAPTAAFPTLTNSYLGCLAVHWWPPAGDPVEQIDVMLTASTPTPTLRRPVVLTPGEHRICPTASAGTTLTATITLHTANGSGPTSPPTRSVMLGAPETPSSVTVRTGDGEAIVSWATGRYPDFTGSVITPYRNGVAETPQTSTEVDMAGCSVQSPILSPQSNCRASQRVTGLTNGASYTFKVVAHRPHPSFPATIWTSTPGTSAPATMGLLNAPGFPLAKAGPGRATVAWWPSALPATGAVITPYLDGAPQTPITFVGGASAQTVTGLVSGGSYTFTIALTTSVGTGPPSQLTNVVIPT